MKKASLTLFVVACIAFLTLGYASLNKDAGNYSVSIHVADYTLQGPPTITVSFIDQVLTDAYSPAAGTGAALYSLGVQYGIDPIYALAFFHHESNYGTTGEATVTHSLGNERCITDRPCIDAKHGGYAAMQSWIDGYDHWYSLILNQYIKQWQRLTVEQIIPKYAPNSDGNNEAAYINAVEQDVVTWRSESQVNG